MKELKKNEELQSRREFFKKAAKGALPVIAAVALASVPSVVKAAEAVPSSCAKSCGYGCATYCVGTCKGSCDRLCLGGCFSNCQGGCKGSSKY